MQTRQRESGLVERRALRLDTTARESRLVFTDPRIMALRAMMADARWSNPIKFTYVRQELGIVSDPGHGRADT